MTATIMIALGIACLVLAAGGCVFALGAAMVVAHRGRTGNLPPAAWPGVTILKPLSGVAPGLGEDLASFCDQDYGGPVQILFGVQDSSDAVIELTRRLIAERPGREIELVIHPPGRGPNPKVANVAALEEKIRYEIVIVADADIAVTPDYLSRVISALEPPGVGAVTCLYRGIARGGVWARLATMGIDYHFLPNVLVGLRLGLARPCFGSTIALRRETLEAIRGFRAFVNLVADDYAIGEAVRATGAKVTIPWLILTHACTEQSVADLLRHELRWARTIRAVSPLGYAGSIVTHPLPLALVGAALTGFGVPGLAMIAIALACRLALQLQVDHTLQVSRGRWWLGPARDLLAFGIFVASYFVDVVSWRGQRYRIRRDGTLIAVGEQKA